ncbi:hypothetical protein CKK19_04510 [Enterobacter sp. CCUG 70166]|nr:hypothetical protein [Enterobacter sp. CCUG 70166]
MQLIQWEFTFTERHSIGQPEGFPDKVCVDEFGKGTGTFRCGEMYITGSLRKFHFKRVHEET